MLTIQTITALGRAVIRLSDSYNKRITENDANLLLFGYLSAKAKVPIQREHHIKIAGTTKRFDFRCGGTNPVYLEFAVRCSKSGVELYGSQNKSELRKLTRVPASAARLRALLLVDTAKHPIDRKTLKKSYDAQNSGKGRFERHSVRVIYCHRLVQYHFVWKPF